VSTRGSHAMDTLSFNGTVQGHFMSVEPVMLHDRTRTRRAMT
jgi:hypothetical protein